MECTQIGGQPNGRIRWDRVSTSEWTMEKSPSHKLASTYFMLRYGEVCRMRELAEFLSTLRELMIYVLMTLMTKILVTDGHLFISYAKTFQ